MKKGILLLLALFILVMIMVFQKQDFSDRAAMIQAKVDERVEEYRLNLLKRCRDKVMKEAGIRVDSILIARSEEIHTIDSIPRPAKPLKPSKPVVPPLEESEPIIPMLKDKIEGEND